MGGNDVKLRKNEDANAGASQPDNFSSERETSCRINFRTNCRKRCVCPFCFPLTRALVPSAFRLSSVLMARVFFSTRLPRGVYFACAPKCNFSQRIIDAASRLLARAHGSSKNSFQKLLQTARDTPRVFPHFIKSLPNSPLSRVRNARPPRSRVTIARGRIQLFANPHPARACGPPPKIISFSRESIDYLATHS